MIRDSLILARRSITKMLRNPEQFIDVTLQPIIMTVLFVFIFGGAVAGNTEQYLPFVLPGIIVQTIMFTAMTIGVNLNTDLKNGVFDRFRSLPISRSAPLVGAVMADVVRYLILFVVTMSVGLLMGFQVGTGWLGVLAALGISMAFALCFAWISVFVGMIARTSGAVQGIMFLLVLPLGFASNTYVPTSTLPSWMQTFVSHNPITYLVSTVRGLMVGGPVAENLIGTLVWMAGLVVVFVPLALWAYRRRA